MRASIAIFQQKASYSDNRPQPEVPDAIFETCLKLIERKEGCELVRDQTGLYVIMYSETGPGKRSEGWESWAPIYIAKVETWSSGGVKKEELEKYIEQKNVNP